MLARSCLTIAALALCCNRAGAQQKPFYAGKQLTILVNYDAGGPTDLEARLLSRHLGRHIPGHPTVVVQNMPGAGSLRSVNWLNNLAPRDGTAIAHKAHNMPIILSETNNHNDQNDQRYHNSRGKYTI